MHPRPRWRPAVLRVLLVGPALLAGILILGTASPADAQAADPGIHPRADRRPTPSHEVYGYLPYWQVDAATARQLDYRQLSTIAIFAVPIRPDGSLDRRAAGYGVYVGPAALAITNAAHARGVRVVPTFQLFNVSTLRWLLDHPAGQARFIRQALDLMARRRADGANLDVEPVPATLASEFAAFVGRFSRQMHQRFPGSELTVATPAIVSDGLLKGLEPVVDRFFVMAYDYNWGGSPLPGAVAPLNDGTHNVAKTIRNYVRLVPREKLILGVPLYGYSWPVVRVGGSWRVRPDPARWGGVRSVTYGSVLAWLARNPSVTIHRDPVNGSWFQYLNRADRTVRQVHFENSASAAAKFNFAIAEGLAGVGIWSLGNDAGQGGMANAIQRTFVRPIRRVTARVGVETVRLVRGVVGVAASIVLSDQGSRAERGTLAWRILDPRGRTVASGRRVAAVLPGGQLRQQVTVKLGRASSLRAGTYQLRVSFHTGSWSAASSTARFYQPY